MRWECRHMTDHEKHGTYNINDILFTEHNQDAVPQTLAAMSEHLTVRVWATCFSIMYKAPLQRLNLGATFRTHKANYFEYGRNTSS